MLTVSEKFKMVAVAMSIFIATPVFAESAPVYDADSMPDNSGLSDQAQYLPPPPGPQQETSSAFIPVQPTVSSIPQQAQLNIDQRIQRVEQQINNMQTSEAAARVDSLQDQVQAMRGQIEQLTHQLEQLQTQQKSMYTDLDGRLSQSGSVKTAEVLAKANPKTVQALETPAEPENTATADRATVADNASTDELPVETPTSPSKPILIKTSRKQTVSSESKEMGQPNVAEEQQIYQTAYNFIKAKRYSDAVTALQSMLKKYPSGQFASNAHYWLGELYGLMGKNEQALGEFKLVVGMYPDSPRVSDAQLKVGLLLASQLKWPEAKSALKRVINHYPGSASARLAAEQLKQIKIAGH